ncbi:hypothetical protein BGZ83_011553 [Gryganskiella cystojenkinii]|nr:hypothetical protein BGZ83_011553 [Gryganskiella cystojenkinii]
MSSTAANNSNKNTTGFIAFFGATGGCTNAALVHALNADFHATALARTPSKLVAMLLEQGIPQTKIDSQLTIIKGDIASVSDIKAVLFHKDQLTSQIISGVGGTPRTQLSLKTPFIFDHPEICATATNNIIQGLKEIYAAFPTTAIYKPSIVVISTTGVSDMRQDVPFGFRTFYHVALAVPHKDKKVMEEIVTLASAPTTASGQIFGGAVVVRPSLLTGDHSVKTGKGWKKIRVGTEEKPKVGYFISRADVGEWVFHETIKTGGQKFFGQKVTLTN